VSIADPFFGINSGSKKSLNAEANKATGDFTELIHWVRCDGFCKGGISRGFLEFKWSCQVVEARQWKTADTFGTENVPKTLARGGPERSSVAAYSPSSGNTKPLGNTTLSSTEAQDQDRA